MSMGRSSIRSRPGRHRRARPLVLLALSLTSISCVPAGRTGIAPVSTAFVPETVPNLPIPAFSAPDPAQTGRIAAAAFVGRTPLDRLRALDCLAQAIYYEAGNESEEGRRAVAQVVLNRVRNPAFPDSVCGVVYQGPLRVGGGCQFTFTCDGSLARAPVGPRWAEARRIAREALAGRSFAPVGLATHYHADYVAPSWAPGLIPLGAIGAHLFYRMPGSAGAPAAFTAAYSGREPMSRPAAYTPRRPVPEAAGLAPLFTAAVAAGATRAPAAVEASAPANLPPSTIREEWRHSGEWRPDAPAVITGAR
jgi:hypothetical protein